VKKQSVGRSSRSLGTTAFGLGSRAAGKEGAGSCSAGCGESRSSPPAMEGSPVEARAGDQASMGARWLRPWTCGAHEIRI
jgi:hypothetical protein